MIQDNPVGVRTAQQSEVDHLARIWFDGWQDAHADILPAELRRLRTLESFQDRLRAALPNVRVVGRPGSPAGFCIVKDNELDQLYVSAEARGFGVAAMLMKDAEARFAANGIELAWLACAIGNERAARFYEKCGWRRVGVMMHYPETPEGKFPLQVWRYEKALGRDGCRISGYPTT